MTTPHRCICQHEDPNSPYPPGYDGCTPDQRPRRLYTTAPDPAALPLADVLSAVQLDSGNADNRPLSLAALIAQDAQLAIARSVPRPEPFITFDSTRPLRDALKEH